jgi:DNA-binding NarL/FixJ family response regulator|tara:strand:+ start:42 stop:284 length:243 start_codon:yes stop_codon:yes gene_type:complete
MVDFVDDTDPSWPIDVIDWLGCHLTPDQISITVMLLSGNTHSEIATNLGCYRQTITAMVAVIRTKAKKETLPHEIKGLPS